MDLAKQLAGNWKKFVSFSWRDAPEDGDNWTIVYTHNRDSDIVDQANAITIEKEMAPFLAGEDVRRENHGHWACGWVRGYAIRVYGPDGSLTPAFTAYAELAAALEQYPILDEALHDQMENEEANAVWSTYGQRARIDYIIDHREEFNFHSFADMLACARGKYFSGDASELLA